MAKQEGEGLLGTLVSAFRDENLGMSRYRGLPSIRDETAQSHLFRIMDFWNTEMWDDTSTNAISKEVILTLLQCAARLYEDKIHVKAAVDLIESNHTRAILSLGIQDVLCRVAHQRYVESTRSDKSEERNTENCSRRADLFSGIRKNKARQLNYQAMVFEHISSLCRSHAATLQNSFDSPRIDEQFMFHNYVTLSKAFHRYEKTWLITLFPDIFQWEGQDSYGSVNGDGLLAPNFGATKEVKRDASSNESRAMSLPQAPITPNITRGANQNVNMPCEKPISLESVEYLLWSLPWGPGEPSPLITDGGVQLSLGQVTPSEQNELRGVCGESGAGNSDSDSESFALTNKVLEFEKWIDLLRKRAMNYPKLTSVRAVTSALKAPHEFHDQTTPQKEERRPFGIKIERKDTGDSHKEWKDGLLSPSSDISNRDWNLLGSDDDSGNIFPFSPDSRKDAANRRLVPTLPRSADNKHYSRIPVPSAKGAHPAFPFVGDPPLKSTNKDSQRWSNLFEPGEWTRGQHKTMLSTIPEVLQGQLDVERRKHNEPETALKMADTSLPVLPHAFHNQKLVVVKKPPEDDPGFGAECDLEKGRRRM